MSLKQTVNNTNYAKDSEYISERQKQRQAISETIWNNRDKIMLAVKALDNIHNSIDTKCKGYTSIANKLSKDNSPWSLQQALRLYTEAWDMQCKLRGDYHPRATTAYLKVYNIQDKVIKAKAGRDKTRRLLRSEQKAKEDEKKKKEEEKKKKEEEKKDI